jgi:hypothetical protein
MFFRSASTSRPLRPEYLDAHPRACHDALAAGATA